MARKQVDVFGFDELEKAFVKMEKKYAVQSEALLAAQALLVKKRVKQRTPIGKGSKKPETLRKSWSDLKPKEYQGGKVKVSRVQNAAPHAHLYEYPHNVYTTKGNRKTGKVTRYNSLGRKVEGIKSHGQTEGHYILRNTVEEIKDRFPKGVEDMLDKVTKEVQV